MQEELTGKAPWYVSGTRTRHNSMPVLQIISEPSGEVLALVPYSDRTPKAHAECYADARLIAAAPDLLAALQSLMPIVEEIHAKWDEGMRAGKLLIALMDPSLKYRDDITAIHAAIAKATGTSA